MPYSSITMALMRPLALVGCTRVPRAGGDGGTARRPMPAPASPAPTPEPEPEPAPTPEPAPEAAPAEAAALAASDLARCASTCAWFADARRLKTLVSISSGTGSSAVGVSRDVSGYSESTAATTRFSMSHCSELMLSSSVSRFNHTTLLRVRVCSSGRTNRQNNWGMPQALPHVSATATRGGHG